MLHCVTSVLFLGYLEPCNIASFYKYKIITRVEETKGRLVRDDDNDRSDDEEGESRMDFSLNQQARDRQQRREAFAAAQGGDIILPRSMGLCIHHFLTAYHNIVVLEGLELAASIRDNSRKA